ncbi:DUF3084 domain-containing protein [Thermosynechococcus sp. CL-1]|uniref:DUF3084 domain-containing protein n=1 Tax=unclassified Thermosynechococcus TaxID=2622553 RepID=UPI00122E7717|nr:MULTISPECIES: DUF3084 domain-containing protein [unclassified Thermosynechococcus]QEQ01222.1 DUF3084 domain-containing protein [Thermosynechococcus sp. CL-1]WKT82665.1 DUF3084 domain-containing protein [Thermosynechococcus sp. HY596]WNC61791.1 DUF3084 domain-containing protein [Thermosynechococcus sp. HY591]WNC64346.1 DUF3084 domain-containing protein [Thermosynechococcus sp. HY593]
MAGYVLVLAVIILGGAIATVGDRLGSKVGKARLSWFNLRPRQTAVLITILTGSLISASTLAILFALSRELRDGVLRIDTIRRQQAAAEQELAETRAQKDEIEAELAQSQIELANIRQRLSQTNQVLEQAVNRQTLTEAELKQLQDRYTQAQKDLENFEAQGARLRQEIQRLQRERQAIQGRLEDVAGQKAALETAIRTAQQRLAEVEGQKDRLQAEIDRIQDQLAVANQQQQVLRNQQRTLQQEIAALEASRQRLEENVSILLLGLRRGTIAIRTGQVLASAVIQNVKDSAQATQVIEELLRQARRNAIVLNNPQNLKPTDQVIQITTEDVNRLRSQISDGQPYVVRILAAANYLQGESNILVVPQVARNQEVFREGENLATISLDPSQMTDEQILQRLDQLFTVSNQRAIASGVLPDPVTGSVGSFRQIELVKFVLDLKDHQGTIDISAVTPTSVYTAGPLTLSLVARQNQRVILRSG